MKTPWVFAASAEIAQAEELPGSAFRRNAYRFSVCRTASALWLRVRMGGRVIAALRLAYAPDNSLRVERAAAGTYNAGTSFARFRVKVSGSDTVRAQVWTAPLDDLSLSNWPRDLVLFTPSGTIHTHQRGLRSGIVYASAPECGTVFYFQNYTSLAEYFDLTHTSPADRTGGVLPEVGFSLPANEEKPLPAGREFCISDAFVRFSPEEPGSDGALAQTYLEHLAQTYCALPRTAPEYHDWPNLAQESLRSLSFSPLCTISENGHTYLAPYAGDKTRPPESMVQLTVLLPMHEYCAWSKGPIALVDKLVASIPSFFDSKVECLVRWPDGKAAPGPPDLAGNTRYMDSWYLYHALFNLGRLVKRTGDERLRELLRRSLTYARRVAHRFEYRWPVFFDLDTLEILRAEARDGAGGENDVSGLYAHNMLQAYELFGEDVFLVEAKEAAKRLRGLGFNVAYQMNATGFGAEGLLRLYLLTGDKEYLDLSYLCLANVFDNMWLWNPRYGIAKDYRTFFGMFPLPDAPYLAAYEELECASKFREYLRLANDIVPPSVRLLLAEYCRYALDRGWYYFPRNLPQGALAEHANSGVLSRELAVPVEDLRDGWDKCGQVGQEVYGAGIAPGLTLRHYYPIEAADSRLYCDYPAFNLRLTEARRSTTVTMRIAGDRKGACSVRLIPLDVAKAAPRCTMQIDGRNLNPTITPEGHSLFTVPGNALVKIRIVHAHQP